MAGEPGIGKTRLAEALSGEARNEGALVLWGRCWEDGGAPAYWPWLQVIRSYIREREPEALAAELGTRAGLLAQVAPELLPGLEVPEGADDERDRFALFDATAAFLREIAKERPLLLVFDDLHAADRPSLLLLEFAVRELRRAPVLVLGTYRDVEARLTQPVAKLLGRLSREGRTIELRGLTRPDVGRFIGDVSGTTPPEGVVAAVHEATEGNPFFVSEVVGLLSAEGRLDTGDGMPLGPLGLPEGARQAIARRLELLSPQCTDLLATASVVGREFTLALLERLAARPPSKLRDQLGEAAAAGIVVERSPALGRYAFSHALIRETLYSTLAPARRAVLHRQVGDALESLYSEAREPHLAELAHHFFQAAQAGEAERALEYSEQAGRRAMAQLAYEEAAAHYERSLEALELHEPGNDARRLELLLALGSAQLRAGEMKKKRESALRAAELARRMKSPEGLARAAQGLGAGWWASGLGTVDEVVRSHLEEALEALGPDDSVLRLRLLARLDIELQFSREHERVDELTREAVEMARRLRDPAALGWALTHRHHAAFGVEHPRERLRLSEEIIALGEGAGRRQLSLWGHVTRVTNLVELGELQAAEAEAGTVARLSQELRLPSYRWYLAMWKTMRALTEGRLEDAERLSLEALEVGRPIHGETAAFFYGTHLWTLRWQQGRLDEIVPAFAATVEQERTSPTFRAGLAFGYAEVGRMEDARREFERFAAEDFELPRNFAWPVFMASLGFACARLGDSARAPVLYERLLPLGDRYIIGGGLAQDLLWPASLGLGVLAATMRRLEDARRHFEDALAKSTRIGQRPYLALAQLEYARALLAGGHAGDRGKAEQLLAEAVRTAEEIGMPRVAEQARALEAAAAAGAAPDEATFRREGDFWTLAYGGRSVRLKDSRGLRHIATLLANPNREISALELAGGRAAESAAGARDARELGLAAGGLGAPDDLLDSGARAAYKRRLDELSEELEQAEAFHDPERAARAREELDFLSAELTRAAGIGKSARRAPAPAERARVSVTKAIRQSLRRIDEEHEPLGRHLAAAVKTGTFCRYMPGGDVHVAWRL